MLDSTVQLLVPLERGVHRTQPIPPNRTHLEITDQGVAPPQGSACNNSQTQWLKADAESRGGLSAVAAAIPRGVVVVHLSPGNVFFWNGENV